MTTKKVKINMLNRIKILKRTGLKKSKPNVPMPPVDTCEFLHWAGWQESKDKAAAEEQRAFGRSWGVDRTRPPPPRWSEYSRHSAAVPWGKG